MVVNTETTEVTNQTVVFPRDFKSSKDMEQATREAIDTDVITFVTILDVSHDRGVYAISELDFMAHAVKIADSRYPAGGSKEN